MGNIKYDIEIKDNVYTYTEDDVVIIARKEKKICLNYNLQKRPLMGSATRRR